jgi:probable addiction module antidote protein
MSKRSHPFRDTAIKALRDPEVAAEYLNAALEEDDPAFFRKALREVAQARGITATAEAADLNRVSLYRMLSEEGNPELNSIDKLLHALGLRLSIQADDHKAA